MGPRVGLLTLAAGWFWDKGIQGTSVGRYSGLSSVVEEDAQRIAAKLKVRMDVVETGIVHSVDQAIAAREKLRSSKIDLLVVCHLMWTEDQPLAAALNGIGDVPVLVWCYSPHDQLPAWISAAEMLRRSGPVGTLQSSITLKKLGISIAGFVIGSPDDDNVVNSIGEYAEAARLSSELKEITIGVVPYRCELMMDTYVDEFRLMRQIGPRLKFISVAEFASAVEKVEESEATAYVDDLNSKYEIRGVKDRTLFLAARLSLGLAKLAEVFHLDAIALDDINDELHRTFGLRPCLYPPVLNEMGVNIGMEGDVTGTLACVIMNRLSGQPAMFSEIYNFDLTDNSVIAGHAGPQNVLLARNDESVKIVTDHEYDSSSELEGAWMYFKVKPGRITMLNLVCEENGFKMVSAGGEALDGPERLEGFGHIHVRLDAPVDRFFLDAMRTGVTHHWAIVHADIAGKLAKLADYMGLETLILR